VAFLKSLSVQCPPKVLDKLKLKHFLKSYLVYVVKRLNTMFNTKDTYTGYYFIY